MTQPALRRVLATIAVLFTLVSLTPAAVHAAETRDGRVASASLDFEPRNRVLRLYEAVLGRAPDDGGLAYWTSRLQTDLNLEQIASALSESPEFVAKYGNLDNRGFVVALYSNIFGRTTDTDGINYWTGLLDQRQMTRNGVIVWFSESPEFRNKTYDSTPLDRLYCAFFLRDPDAGGKTYWNGIYRDQNVALPAIASVFAAGPEFGNTYGALSARQFVELIYKNVLGRPLPLTETEGPDYWTSLLVRGQLSRGDVMVNFSESQEYKNRFDGNGCPAAGRATPIAVADRGTVTNGGSVSINWAQNDTLPTGTTVVISQQPTKGTVAISGKQTFTYTHNGVSTAATTDTFKYRLTSADGVTATATVTITILASGADGIPTAVDDVATTPAGQAVQIPWAENDTTDSSVTIKSVTTPANGTVTTAGNTFTYTPKAGFTGTDTFQYTLTDGGAPADESTATVTVIVTSGAGGVGAVDDRAITPKDTAVVIPWSANDSAASVTEVELTQPGNGTVVDNGNGTFTYTPTPGYSVARTFNGVVGDTFTYTVLGTDGKFSTASVEVLVLAKPECEVFMNYPYLADEGTAAAGTRIELFFSNIACSELYDFTQGFEVNWTNVKLDGVGVATTSAPGNFAREFVAVTETQKADGRLDITGTATFTVGGSPAVTAEFELGFQRDAAGVWRRDGSNFKGRGEPWVQVLINPLAS